MSVSGQDKVISVNMFSPCAAQASGSRKRAKRDTGVQNMQKPSEQNIPAWLYISKSGHVSVKKRSKCNYILVHMISADDKTRHGPNSFRIFGQSVAALRMKVGSVWCFYERTRAALSTLHPYVRRAISKVYSEVSEQVFGDVDELRYLITRAKVDLKSIRQPSQKPPARGEFVKSKVTGEHHTHILPVDAWEMCQSDTWRKALANAALKSMREMDGVIEPFVSGVLVYIATANKYNATIVALGEWLKSKDLLTASSLMKDFSTPLKSVHNSEISPLNELFELQVLVNRGFGEVDWQGEREKRQVIDPVKITPQQAYDGAMEVFKMGTDNGYKYRSMTASEYAMTRWEWVPTGSIHSQHEEDAEYVPDFYRHKNKFVALNMMTSAHVIGMLDRPAELHAWTSIKYEWAKQRAIYGVDLTSSVVTNLAMFNVERVFKQRFPVGAEAESKRVHQKAKIMCQDAESFCYDFDDFNSQHSNSTMKAVLQAYYDYFEQDMSDDQKKAMRWTIDSVDHVTVHSPVGEYESKGTLMSGWRLTTFMNTICNWIYFRSSGALDVNGVKNSLHNGDDVMLAVNDVTAAVMVHDRLADINARAQVTKCNLASLSEFLRVEHKLEAGDGNGMQYLTRAIATAVHSRTESQAPTRLTAAVKATITRADELRIRMTDPIGKAAVDRLKEKQIAHLATVFNTDKDTAMRFAQRHVVVGGANTDKWAPVDLTYSEEIPRLKESEVMDGVKAEHLSKGMRDYAWALSRKFDGAVSYTQCYNAVEKATESYLAVTRRAKLRETRTFAVTAMEYSRSLYGMYKSVITIPTAARARFLNVSPVALCTQDQMTWLREAVGQVKDVQKALSILI